ncbi:MAG: SGNH/GDSL hydrolase family protein [Planctomycetaceae bacterium]|nr:SGNH/GDSL hydrolase family protein [Planctomycetaceae bacterium]
MRIIVATVSFTFSGLLLSSASLSQTTDTKDVAAKAAEADRKLDEQYQAWVKTLSPAEQAWERVLQENLGSFYLPIHKRQKVAGQSNAWDFVKDDPQLPRVLLIGDSVSRGYTQSVRRTLAGKANVHRAPANCGPVSLGQKKIDVWLGDGKWDVIHFNFGIHDRNTPVADYSKKLEQLVEQMQKTGARLVWASTTPIPDDAAKRQTAASIVERNKAAEDIMAKYGVVTDDLFSAVTPHLDTMQNLNDVHFNAAGYDFLGGKVAEAITEVLK